MHSTLLLTYFKYIHLRYKFKISKKKLNNHLIATLSHPRNREKIRKALQAIFYRVWVFPRIGWVASPTPVESMLDSPYMHRGQGFYRSRSRRPDLREHFPLESREEICRANFTVTDSIGPTFPRRFHVAKLWWLPRPNPVTRRTNNLSK